MSDAYIADCVCQIGELQDFLTTYKNSNLNIVKIMEQICDTPLIEFDIYNAFDIKSLRNHIRDMEAAALEKILNMYKEIITYVVIVYEGFEAYITQMAEYWVKYVRKLDCMAEDAFRLSIKATMQNMYKCVHGDGTMAPAPLIKMDLYLSGQEIVYIPTKYEVRDTFTTVLDEIVHILSTIPRLFEKFALPSGNLRRFYECIQIDQDCNKLQSLIDNEIEYNIGLILDHVYMWDPYAHIWTVDKDTFLEKYREEKHTAAEFDALIINYSDLANTVQIQETVNQMPATLKELATSIATYERLMSELEGVEKTFPPITDQMQTLEKFEVEVSTDLLEQHENIPILWANYLALLEEAKKALEANKDKFKADLLEQAEDASESRSSENGERTREVGGSLGPGIPMGGVMGSIQDTDFLGNGDG